jgi:hypothetical protein
MADAAQDEVRIFVPDTGLKEKLGLNVSFDQVVSPRVIAAAEATVTQSAGSIFDAIQVELEHMKTAVSQLKEGLPGQTVLPPLVAHAFAIKSNAGLCGYPFASLLAKSLCVFCELDSIVNLPLDGKSLKIIHTQVEGLNLIFTNKLVGNGGVAGAAILSELQKLTDAYI